MLRDPPAPIGVGEMVLSGRGKMHRDKGKKLFGIVGEKENLNPNCDCERLGSRIGYWILGGGGKWNDRYWLR